MLNWSLGQVTGLVETFHNECHGKLKWLPSVTTHA
jgi:hypothetical protein